MIIGSTVALQALRDLVTEKGADFVYQRPGGNNYCVYAYEGVPSCGIGQVLSNLGVSIDKIIELDAPGTDPTEFAVGNIGVEITSEAGLLFSTFQSWQDCSKTYAEALQQAELTLKPMEE